MNTAYSQERWQQTADYVLAPLIGEGLRNKDTLYWLSQTHGLIAADFPPGKWYDTFVAAGDCIFAREPVHLTTLAARMRVQSNGYHAQLAALCGQNSTLTDDVFLSNLKELKRLAQTARDLQTYNHALTNLKSGNERNGVAEEVIAQLTTTGDAAITGETAADSGQSFRQWMDSTGALDFMTGIDQMDTWCNGILQGSLLVLSAAMKQRKTTFLLNLMLSLVRSQGMSVALMMFENTRQMIVAQCVAMLAVEYLIQHNLYNVPVKKDSSILHRFIAPDSLVKMRNRYRNWKDARVEAIDHSINIWQSLENKFRIYDRTPQGGGLSDIASIRRIAKRDSVLYGTQFIGIDHAQRIDEPGSEYEKLTKIAPFVETYARSEGITTCLLAQLNVRGIREGENEYTAGIRGGNILDEAGDYLFKTHYRYQLKGSDTKLPDNKLVLELKHNRYGAADIKAVLDIDPYTGLLLNAGRGVSLESYTIDPF